MGPLGFTSGREGTDQIILRTGLFESEGTPPGGERTPAQSKGKPETEQTICYNPRGGVWGGQGPRGRRCRATAPLIRAVLCMLRVLL